MSNQNLAIVEQYRNNFLKEVEANVEEGEWVKMCMQCGVCSGSCPLGPYWDHGPQEIFMMIRAGKRDEVLRSSSMWMCTSCYNCIARCPRELPITHIMHGLAHYAMRLGLAPKEQPTHKFTLIFWDNFFSKGEVRTIRSNKGFTLGYPHCLYLFLEKPVCDDNPVRSSENLPEDRLSRRRFRKRVQLEEKVFP